MRACKTKAGKKREQERKHFTYLKRGRKRRDDFVCILPGMSGCRTKRRYDVLEAEQRNQKQRGPKTGWAGEL